ncbi:phosphoadenosine phosphosulfate reductase [Lipingzhangella halophila]|uniref:Adenosine 5'-phosphosulfate reductase n=1 Tax=Lipingzhangella halophila TaxID=1783352 RepID=A0A7W7RHS5_9ACTN|nr:phosphoadenylyl-sulfate reductase [Lipingzhangella halophila]MBB4932135.1 phosphoadenosine phosphosulfate reductase [Lipingzhangella halophila]
MNVTLDTLDGDAIAKRAAAELEDASPQEIIQWAAETFGDRLCMTSSMADALMVDLVSKVRPGIDVIFLDTGYHFAETIGTRDAVAQIYDINLINVLPQRSVAEQDRDLGPRLHGRNPEICCHLRKVEPLQRALEPYDAWITGVRRDEALTRRGVGVVQWDRRKRMVKVNPIARWSREDVDTYMEENGVLVNPLQYDGYPSIGCAPCTQAVDPGDDPRSGRWAGSAKTECGIHL